MAPVNTVPHVIKLGKLYSPSNLKLRAEYFEQKYGECMGAQKIPDKTDKDYAIKSSEFYQRFPSRGFKGFDFKKCDLDTFYMEQEMIEELEMHAQYTSDEESLSDEEEETQRLILPLCFDFERGLTFKGNTLQSMSEDSDGDDSSDEDERSERRPVSRLSLEVDDETYDSSFSECDSDYYYGESEAEDDNVKKVIYGIVPGVAVGDVWKTRRQCSRSLAHIPVRARIHCGSSAGCSIVLSSKEMINDRGVTFTYTNKAKLSKSDKIMAHQLIGGNKALQNNFWKGTPLRVIRSYQLGNRFAPKKGYRYDGLYDVKDITYGEIKNGYQYCEANFERCSNQPPPPWARSNTPTGYLPDPELSTTEIDYTSADEYESSDDSETPTPSRSITQNFSGPKMNPIVLVKRLTKMQIEKATNAVSTPKDAVRKSSYLQQEMHYKEAKSSGKRSHKPRKSKKLVSAKISKSSEKSQHLLMGKRNAAAKLNRTNIAEGYSSAVASREASSPKRKRTLSLSYDNGNSKRIKSRSENKGIIKSSREVQGSATISDSKHGNRSSNKWQADKNHDLKNKTGKSANSSFLKQKVKASSSYSQKGKSPDEKKAAPGARKKAVNCSSTERSPPEIKQRSQSETVVSLNKKQKLAQAKRGNVERKGRRRAL